jgi:citrate synthase
MNPFWRELHLTDEEAILLREVFDAHATSACRDNCSTQALILAAAGSRSLPNALIAALSTLGERHAPLIATYEFLVQPNPEDSVSGYLERGEKVPGWGNSFHKGEDPEWVGVSRVIQSYFPAMFTKIMNVQATLHSFGKPLYPNPSTYTAATAIILGMPKEVAAYLFIAGRLLTWHELFLRAIK